MPTVFAFSSGCLMPSRRPTGGEVITLAAPGTDFFASKSGKKQLLPYNISYVIAFRIDFHGCKLDVRSRFERQEAV